MFGMIKKLFGDSWDNDLLDEISRRKFLAYTQIAAKNKVFKETPVLFNQYVMDLDKAFKEFIKHIKMTYGDSNLFKDKYESRNMELLDELFVIGEKCIEGYTKSKFKIETKWDEETNNMFSEPFKEEMYDLLKENYLDITDEVRLILATSMAQCFHYKINEAFPNQAILMEHFFIDEAHPFILEVIKTVKSNCMDGILDIYEEELKKRKNEINLKKELKEEILRELKTRGQVMNCHFIK
jgi:hypothetical protein